MMEQGGIYTNHANTKVHIRTYIRICTADLKGLCIQYVLWSTKCNFMCIIENACVTVQCTSKGNFAV